MSIKTSLATRHNIPIEHGIESCDLVYSHWRQFEELRHIIHDTNASPSLVLPLAKIKKRNYSSLLVLRRVVGYNLLGAFRILRSE